MSVHAFDSSDAQVCLMICPMPMKLIQEMLARIDDWQRRSRSPRQPMGLSRNLDDDGMNQFVVALGWYGFLAIYPLLLVVITIFGFIGVASLGHGIVSTLHQFPVIGAQFNPANPSANLHGSIFGLTIGLLGMIYGAQGVTQTAQHSMAQVWNMSELDLPGFLPRLARSLISLFIIGGSFLANAAIASLVTGAGHSFPVRILVFAHHVVASICAVLRAHFAPLPRTPIASRSLFPGALVGSVGFTCSSLSAQA